MDDLEEIITNSRFVTIAKSEGGIIVESNCWLSETNLDAYTVNIRGWGKNLASAANATSLKMKLLKKDFKH